MWESLKSAGAVALITGLIWFVADRNVREEASYQVSVRVISEAPYRYAAFERAPNFQRFVLSVSGRRRELKEFSDLVESKRLFDAVVGENRETSAKPQALSGREILAMIRPFARASVSILAVEPPTVSVRIDEYEVVPDIRVVPNVGELKVVAEPNPERVSVKLPRFAAPSLRADPTARADADQRILAARRPDGAFSVKVPLVIDALKNLDPDTRIEILPSDEVTLTGQIQSLTATARKGPIQITWSIPPQIQEGFRIVVDPATNFRPDIEVSGPKEVVERLDPREVLGLVEVLSADTEKPSAEIRRKVKFILPSDCAIAAGATPHEIAFRLEPRTSPPALGP